MTELTHHDLQFALLRTPKELLRLMQSSEFAGKIFVGGGFLRSVVAGDTVNDIDVFVPNKSDGLRLSQRLATARVSADDLIRPIQKVWETDNALTLLGYEPKIQIIHRWTFASPYQVCQSFDFTCCCAVFWWDGASWKSTCDPRFYADVAAKRLIYRKPERHEDVGGSLLRVLKYYQKGFRIPMDSLADVIVRLLRNVDFSNTSDEVKRSSVILGLLREVDPSVDSNHIAHLPSVSEVISNPSPSATPVKVTASM